MNYAKFTVMMAAAIALKHYLEDQNILSMASVCYHDWWRCP